MEQKLKQIDETLDRCIASTEETTELGKDTIKTLDKQGRQLEKIDKNVKDINVHLSRSERLIRSIRSFGGTLTNMMTTPTVTQPPVTTVVAATQHNTEPSIPETPSTDKLDRLLQNITHIKHQAETINKTLVAQNNTLANIDESVEWTDKRIVGDTKELSKLL